MENEEEGGYSPTYIGVEMEVRFGMWEVVGKTLKMVTAMNTETLGQLQHTALKNPEFRKYPLVCCS
jgi:hypothetical protein